MTAEQRSNIFAKECLTISDLMSLLALSYDAAARLMRDIKRKSDRLHIRGRLHVQDYLEYFDLTARRNEAETVQEPVIEPKVIQAEKPRTTKLLRSKDYIADDTRQLSRTRSRKIYKGGKRRNAR